MDLQISPGTGDFQSLLCFRFTIIRKEHDTNVSWDCILHTFAVPIEACTQVLHESVICYNCWKLFLLFILSAFLIRKDKRNKCLLKWFQNFESRLPLIKYLSCLIDLCYCCQLAATFIKPHSAKSQHICPEPFQFSFWHFSYRY